MLKIRSGAKLIDWTAAGEDRIAQNVRNLFNTFRYEIPYHRTMGVPGSLIDRPANDLMEEARADIAQMLAIYEPRAAVKDVLCSLSAKGNVEIEVVME